MQQLYNLEKQLAQEKRKMAQEEYDLQVKRNAQNKQTSEADIQRENELYAAWKNAETQYIKTLLEIDKTRNTILQQIKQRILLANLFM